MIRALRANVATVRRDRENWMMIKIRTLLFAMAVSSIGTTALADIRVIIINSTAVPHALGPSNYDNSPSNYENSASNYENSVSNYDNSPSNYDNSSSNYANSSRSVIGPSGEAVGHYALSSKGVLNFYSGSGRIAYMPGGGHTQSVFASSGNVWCGSVVENDGELVLAMTQSCYMRFLLN